ncbi:MAG: nucleotidyltransferase domain-containing protein [Gemmatimonadota bacterium]
MTTRRSEPAPYLGDVRDGLTQVARTLPDLAAVYAYGSRARGSAHEGSDLDLALLLHPGARPGPLFAETLAVRLEECLDSRMEVDAHLVDHLPLPVLGRVVTEGVLVFERNASLRVEFEVATRRLYFDFLPLLERDAREGLTRG